MRLLRNEDVPLFVVWEKERPYPWTERNFLETLSSPSTRTFVWERGAAIAGFAVVQLIEEEAYLQNIFVNEKFRRQGLGVAIFHEISSWAKSQGARELLLDVDSNNQPAIALYKKMKMVVLECRKNSYPQGEDAFVMKGVL